MKIDIARHSCAHLLAAAILEKWENTKFGVGPVTSNGFYYDVLVDEPIKLEDLKDIEKRMRRLKNKRLPFVRRDVEIAEAINEMTKLEQPFKLELLELLRTRGSTAVQKEVEDANLFDVDANTGVSHVSLYQVGDFLDLCRGPHVDDSSEVGEFKLSSISGAYWRGNQDGTQLQRIYGLCFATEEELNHELWRLEEAKKRDHRKLGKELDLFAFSEDVGSGLPLWMPNGMVLRDELEQLAKEFERQDGYKRVATPHITKEDLYYRSRHLPYYSEDMYAPMDIDGQNYYLRPMNCPHHHQIYLQKHWSYRQLPLRLSEYGQVYRNEASGALSGLMRVRGFCQNDAHIYCSVDQAKDEFLSVMRLHARYYELLEIEDFWMRLSLPDLDNLKKYVDDVEGWMQALEILREAMKESGYPFTEVEGEAAFYGPKVDFMIKNVLGNEYAISTNQLDFLATTTFDLKYVGPDGDRHPVYVIHRAPLGSHERFVAFLIEQYAGAFPTWLAPVQAIVVPISEAQFAYAQDVVDRVFNADVRTATGGIRIEDDVSNERMQKKIRDAQRRKIPYMLVVGNEEMAAGEVSVRHRKHGDIGRMSIDEFVARVRHEIETRRDT